MDKAQCAATDRLFCAAGDNRNTTSILQLQLSGKSSDGLANDDHATGVQQLSCVERVCDNIGSQQLSLTLFLDSDIALENVTKSQYSW